MRHLLMILIAGVSFQWLQANVQQPKFIKFKGWDIEKIYNDTWEIHTIAVFYNPNRAKVKLKKIDLRIFFSGDYLGNIVQKKRIKVMPKSAFDVPLVFTVTTNDQTGRLFHRLFSVLGMQTFLVRIAGKIKCSVYGLPVKIKIDETEELNVKDVL